MTAATDSATPAPGGGQLSQDGPALVPAARRASSPVPVPGAWLRTLGATRSHLSQQLIAAAIGDGRDGSAQGAPVPATPRQGGAQIRHAVSDLGPAGDASGTLSARLAPVPATPVGDGPECAAVAYVDGLDGSERKVLMHHIAQAFPDVVEAGAGLVAQWRAECAEQRRKKGRRREHDRRRRRAAEAGGD